MSRTPLPRDRAYRLLPLRRHTRMRMHFRLVMSDRRLGHRTHIVLLRIVCARVVRREYRRRSSNDGAYGVVHGLRFGVLDSGFEHRARGCDGGGGRSSVGDAGVRDRGMLVEVVVVIGCCAYDRANLWCVSFGCEHLEGAL